MDRLSIYLADGSYDGSIIMTSTSSSFSAVRVERIEVSKFALDLEDPGIYLLLVGNNSVYVGQSGLDTVHKRILNTHSGSIDSSWHTVVGFLTNSKTISSNELLYIENAMCEYAHSNFEKCLTTTPSKTNCNTMYRMKHYKLSSSQMHTCDQYIEDMQYYISCFPNTIFPAKYQKSASVMSNAELFYFSNPKRDVDAKAEIQTHLGLENSRPVVIKAGSKISTSVSDAFARSDKVKADRHQYEIQGKVIARVLQEDISFPSQSSAGEFLNGTAFNGNANWKRVSDDTPLKQLLK